MKTQETIKKKLSDQQVNRLLKNYSNARQSWEAWCFFVNFGCKKKDFEIVKRVDTHDLLFHLRYLTLKDLHIEAYKLLKQSKNNSDNIFSLLKITAVIYPDTIHEINACLEALEKQHETITGICDIRDKFYAHLDTDYENYLITGTPLAEIHQVFITIERAIALITSPEMLQSYLYKIPSRDDLYL